jgi:hypothetical protein
MNANYVLAARSTDLQNSTGIAPQEFAPKRAQMEVIRLPSEKRHLTIEE